MSRVFDEGRLRFDFGESWEAEQYDSHRDYRKRIGKLKGTRAVDFVGLFERRDLFLFEVKDLRGFRIESKERLSQGQMALEIATKARDTIAGLIAAYRRSPEPEIWAPYIRGLIKQDARLYFVLWLEEDRPAERILDQRRTVTRGVLTQTLKRSLRWLTTKVAIADRDHTPIPNLQVSYLGDGSK